MTHKQFNINGKEFILYCHTWETSRAWGHICELQMNGWHLATARARYYNRTWESYKYQSVMKSAVQQAIELETDLAIRRWKESTGKRVCSAKQKAALMAESEIIQDLRKLYEKI